MSGWALFPRIHYQSYYYRILDTKTFREDIHSLYKPRTVNHLVYFVSFAYIHYPFSFLPLTLGFFLFIIFIGICYYFFFKILRQIYDPLKQEDYLNLISYPIFLLAFIDIYTGNSFGFQLLCLILSYKFIKDEKYIIGALFYALALYKINFLILFPILWSFCKNERIKFLFFTILWVILLNIPMIIFPHLIFDYINAIFFTCEENISGYFGPFQPAHLLAYYPILFLYFYEKKEEYLHNFVLLFFIILLISMMVLSLSGTIFYLW
ncbi:MAG: hypothetical protein ACTSQG_10745 [Promethearchaeota archaeon]